MRTNEQRHHLLHGWLCSPLAKTLGPCKPKSESWIPAIWNLNPESKPFWNMNPRKFLWNLNTRKVEIWIQNLTHFEIWIQNLALFKIWIQNPWSVWNLNPESLDPPYRTLTLVGSNVVAPNIENNNVFVFLQACAAYCFITIPSLNTIFSQLNLYLISGQVAMLNNCLSQGTV